MITYPPEKKIFYNTYFDFFDFGRKGNLKEIYNIGRSFSKEDNQRINHLFFCLFTMNNNNNKAIATLGGLGAICVLFYGVRRLLHYRMVSNAKKYDSLKENTDWKKLDSKLEQLQELERQVKARNRNTQEIIDNAKQSIVLLGPIPTLEYDPADALNLAEIESRALALSKLRADKEALWKEELSEEKGKREKELESELRVACKGLQQELEEAIKLLRDRHTEKLQTAKDHYLKKADELDEQYKYQRLQPDYIDRYPQVAQTINKLEASTRAEQEVSKKLQNKWLPDL